MCAQSSQVEEKRPVKRFVQPIVPELATRLNLTGTVKIEVTIAPNGLVKTTRVIGGHSPGSKHEELNNLGSVFLTIFDGFKLDRVHHVTLLWLEPGAELVRLSLNTMYTNVPAAPTIMSANTPKRTVVIAAS
jgi:hypothetical protein